MKIKFNPLFFVTVFLCCIFGEPVYFLITYVTLIIHELTHLYFLYREKVLVKEISVEPFGICIKTTAMGKVKVGVYLSAPIFNIILSFVFYMAHIKTNNSLFLIFSASNFALGFFNLLPFLPFDGGRAILNHIKKKYFFVFISILGGIFLVFTGFFLLKGTNFNFSLIMAGAFIIANSFSEKEQIFENSAFIYKERYLRKVQDKLETKFLTVPHSYNVHKLIEDLDSRYFYMINVIKDGVVISTLSETMVIEGLINGYTKLEDFL